MKYVKEEILDGTLSRPLPRLGDLGIPFSPFTYSSPFYRAINGLPNAFQYGPQPPVGAADDMVPEYAPGFYGYRNVGKPSAEFGGLVRYPGTSFGTSFGTTLFGDRLMGHTAFSY
ncbi:hypothetical protein GNI_049730 [Gregarina niphandrodes]|uniref:Uncharacterized protein n=1 Tax=Gregarina niphandrodes TaxID=110365 RepID=A0A023B9M8_GRENI|nr:hypothetical protein GNI_049730 [Gregarina niphandrodes]EZG72996.1 hypothetical protein GNI_049730 [Gregarina niphandrodes]|eukprot:XP_011129691.1 hypothetical protein GNI_049730 [Gregarina niphandrodes]